MTPLQKDPKQLRTIKEKVVYKSDPPTGPISFTQIILKHEKQNRHYKSRNEGHMALPMLYVRSLLKENRRASGFGHFPQTLLVTFLDVW